MNENELKKLEKLLEIDTDMDASISDILEKIDFHMEKQENDTQRLFLAAHLSSVIASVACVNHLPKDDLDAFMTFLAKQTHDMANEMANEMANQIANQMINPSTYH